MGGFGSVDRFTDRKGGPQCTGLFEKPVDPYAQYHNDPTKHEEPRKSYEEQKTNQQERQGFVWLLKQLYVGRVVEYHRQKYPNPTLYVHIVRFEEKCGWTLGTGIVVNNLGREHTISLEEIRL
jgi:hypothetical protein